MSLSLSFFASSSSPSSPLCSSAISSICLLDGRDFGFQLLDGSLLGGEVAGDDQRGGISSALYFCLPTVKSGFSLVFLSLSSTMSRGLAASRQPSLDDHVKIVLHGLGPVVHEVLIDIVGVEQLALSGRCPASPRRAFRSAPWDGRHGDTIQARLVAVCPLLEQLGRPID